MKASLAPQVGLAPLATEATGGGWKETPSSLPSEGHDLRYKENFFIIFHQHIQREVEEWNLTELIEIPLSTLKIIGGTVVSPPYNGTTSGWKREL